MEERLVENVTCLGCGCTCDDLTVRVAGARIIEVSPACPVGRSWFGDGRVPARIVAEGGEISFDEALERLSDLLLQSKGNCLVYIGSDLTIQAQRAALTVADLLHATVETETSATAAQGLLTVQRRGRAGATLGEVRNRGDVLLFWGVDPRERYPRFLSRYSVDPVGTHVPQGRAGRFVMSVSVGADAALASADFSIELAPNQEIATLSLIRAAVLGNKPAADTPLAGQADQIAQRLTGARYAVLVHDAEPTEQPRNPLRVEALIALAQALNGPTRACLVSLRAGGNRVGAESVLTWQTGYPFAVDYSGGYPRYRPEKRAVFGPSRPNYQAALLVGTPPTDWGSRYAVGGINPAVIGPRASEAPFAASVAIDTGVAGIHEQGTAYRMDEVPLSLRPCLEPTRSTADVLLALARAMSGRAGARIG